MFKQIFESEPIKYRTPEEWAGIPDGVGLDALYNGYLVTPPRIYAEEIDFPLGMFSKRENTATAISTVSLLAATTRIYWPGYELIKWRFDSASGEFIDRAEIAGDLLTGYLHLDTVTQGFDSSIWAAYDIGEMREFDPEDFTLLQTVDDSHFGRTGISIPLVDKGRDIVLMPDPNGRPSVIVYELSSGSTIRTITVSGAPSSICAEDDTRVYVLGTNNVLNLVDYSTGEVISTHKCPTPPAATFQRLCWERTFRRLIVFSQVDNEPDGACASVLRGHYPVPLATHLTAPIPITPMRKGRTVRVLVRAVGDVGEPIGGVGVTVEAIGGASVVRQSPGADSNGDAFVTLLCDESGSVDLSATSTIDDGL